MRRLQSRGGGADFAGLRRGPWPGGDGNLEEGGNLDGAIAIGGGL